RRPCGFIRGRARCPGFPRMRFAAFPGGRTSTMRSRIIGATAALLTSSLLVALAMAQEEPDDEGMARAQYVLTYGDSDGDNQLRRAEFSAFVSRGPRLQGRPELINQLFQRLDTDRNGSLLEKELAKLP